MSSLSLHRNSEVSDYAAKHAGAETSEIEWTSPAELGAILV